MDEYGRHHVDHIIDSEGDVIHLTERYQGCICILREHFLGQPCIQPENPDYVGKHRRVDSFHDSWLLGKIVFDDGAFFRPSLHWGWQKI